MSFCPSVNLRTSLSPHRDISPVLFTRPDQHPSVTASDLVSFGGSDDVKPEPHSFQRAVQRDRPGSMGQEEERSKLRCNRTTPQKSLCYTPLISGCGRQSVCEKYCCEHWVLSHSTHTANRCYSEKNKTNIFKKRALFLFHLSRASGPR